MKSAFGCHDAAPPGQQLGNFERAFYRFRAAVAEEEAAKVAGHEAVQQAQQLGAPVVVE